MYEKEIAVGEGRNVKQLSKEERDREIWRTRIVE